MTQFFGSDVLLQITDRACLQCALYHVLFCETRQRNDFDLRVFLVDLARGGDAVRAGHHQIHQHDIGFVKGHHLHGFGAVGSLANEFEILVDHEEFR